MNETIAIGSKFALEAQAKGFNNYSFNDGKYVYDFDIIDKSNNSFRITNVELIKNISEEVADETNSNSNSKYSLDTSGYEERLSDSNNKSARYGNSSNENVRIPTREQEQRGINENRQFIESEKKNRLVVCRSLIPLMSFSLYIELFEINCLIIKSF